MKTFKKNHVLKNKQGFSIGEVILSIFILIVVVSSVAAMYLTALNDLMDERDNVVSSLLSQEGVELARNIRDNNWASENDSFDGLDEVDNCSLDYDNSSVCGNESNLDLYYNGNFYTYSPSDADETRFKRRIIIEDPDSGAAPGDRIRDVLSIVTWSGSDPEPPSTFNKDDCTTSNKCVFSEAILTEWGGP